MATPEEKAQAAKEKAITQLCNKMYCDGHYAEGRAIAEPIIDELIAAERASWQQRERVYCELLMSSVEKCFRCDGSGKIGIAPVFDCPICKEARAALAQTESEESKP